MPEVEPRLFPFKRWRAAIYRLVRKVVDEIALPELDCIPHRRYKSHLGSVYIFTKLFFVLGTQNLSYKMGILALRCPAPMEQASTPRARRTAR